MLTKADLIEPTLLEGWLRDMALTPIRRPSDGLNNWNLEFTIQGASPLVLNAVNPKALPRAVMLVCGMMAVQEHVTAFAKLTAEQRKDFWQDLRASLNREFVEFQIEGVFGVECPKALRVTAIRFDDGMTLDSFARTISSVCKACGDAVAHFTERLGDGTIPARVEPVVQKQAMQ